ncbi:hypothetical protein [Nostoc sp.]|uniref:hypothetical protein n=1 Tax=Nostoc sp. TaxID=1180 RepID=UPI002FF471D4
MITKIISGLLGVSIVLSSSSVLAEPVYMGRTNDGRSLFYNADYNPTMTEDFLLVFEYILKGERGAVKRVAVTPWCTGGDVRLHPIAKLKTQTPGWYTKTADGAFLYVEANSPGSKKMLKFACEVVEFKHAEATADDD